MSDAYSAQPSQIAAGVAMRARCDRTWRSAGADHPPPQLGSVLRQRLAPSLATRSGAGFCFGSNFRWVVLAGTTPSLFQTRRERCADCSHGWGCATGAMRKGVNAMINLPPRMARSSFSELLLQFGFQAGHNNGAIGSFFCSAMRFSTSAVVNFLGSSRGVSSSQSRGVDTVASGTARMTYGGTT